MKKVLDSWGAGRFDAELDKDGKAFRPDGKQAGTLIPPAFGLAGVNLHTWTGFGSVAYWNAYVAATEMHGSGVYYDASMTRSKGVGRGNAPGSRRALRNANAKRQAQATKARRAAVHRSPPKTTL